VEDLAIERTDKMVRRLLDCIETHADDGHYRALELGLELNLLSDGIAARAVRVMQRGLALKPTGPELTAAERAAFLAREWKVEDAAPKEDPLEAVYAAPNDDARKQVLADVLLERGDPRGEFISLQLSNTGTRRQQSLLAHHRDEWLGPLHDVLELKRDKPLFQKGFLSALTVKASLKRSQFQLVADAPEWATVKRVRSGLPALSRAMKSLEHPGPMSLEALKRWTRDDFTLPLRSLKTSGDPQPLVEVLQQVPFVPPWLSLRFIEWEPTRQLRDALVSVSKLGGLERLRVAAQDADVVPAILKETGLEFLPRTLTQLELNDDGDRVVELVRDGRKWSMTLREFEGRPPAHRWKPVLRSLAFLELSSVRLVVSTEAALMDADEIAELTKRFQLPMGVSVDPGGLAW
jgi:uncharacterized protein (TIGR02996 family)